MDANEFMKLGLILAKYKFPNQCKVETNIKRFHSHFGVDPITCEKLWLHLQSTSNEEGCINLDTKPVFLLIGLRFLWMYETEEVLASFFCMSTKTVQNYYRESTAKLYLLFGETLTPIEEIDDELSFILSIDGTHCPIEEPKPWSEKWSSHKLGKSAGLAYEVGLQIESPDLAWVNGPFPAGDYNDLDMFWDKLKGKLQTLNSRCAVNKQVSY